MLKNDLNTSSSMLSPEVEKLIPKIAGELPIEQLLKLADYDFEKDALNVMPILKGVGHTGARAAKWLGESLGSLTWGARGGLTRKQVYEPLARALQKNPQPLSEVRKWDYIGSIRDMGKLKKYQPAGEDTVKGMMQYGPKGNVVTQDLPKGWKSVGKRMLNMPRFMAQELHGRRGTRADFVLQNWVSKVNKANKTKLSPGEYYNTMINNPSMKKEFINQLQRVQSMPTTKFIKENPGLASRYYATQVGHKGLLAGLPAYDIAMSASGKGDPTKSIGENIGSSAGSGAGLLGSMPMGLGGSILAIEGLSAGGGYLGRGISKLLGAKRPETQAKQLFGTHRPIQRGLPEPSPYARKLLLEEVMP